LVTGEEGFVSTLMDFEQTERWWRHVTWRYLTTRVTHHQLIRDFSAKSFLLFYAKQDSKWNTDAGVIVFSFTCFKVNVSKPEVVSKLLFKQCRPTVSDFYSYNGLFYSVCKVC
jgi:hypothetical protein